jgi:hypothetical protein
MANPVGKPSVLLREAAGGGDRRLLNLRRGA